MWSFNSLITKLFCKIFPQEQLVALGELANFQPYQSGNLLDMKFYRAAIKIVLKYVLKQNHYLNKFNPHFITFQVNY